MKVSSTSLVVRVGVLLALLLPLVACGGGGGGSDDSSNSMPLLEFFFGEDGNIYKPVSDRTAAGGGNLVVLFSASFTEQFDSCQAVLATGEVAQLLCINDQEWTQIPFSCFSNGNRQTWRANFTCDKMAEVKVSCFQLGQELVFTVPEAVRGQVCTRFG